MKKYFKSYKHKGLPGGPNELKSFTEGFIVSSEGQYKYPGMNTYIPNANGRITMKGVGYPLLGIDDEGNSTVMQPGGEYQFPGNGVYEIPLTKDEAMAYAANGYIVEELSKKQKAGESDDIAIYSTILDGIGAPVTDENLKFLKAWRQAEGGTAANNPFNTTYKLDVDQNKTDYNSVGVKNYSTPEHGIEATIKTLQLPYYKNIVSGLQNDAGASNIAANTDELKTWGTGAGVARVLNGGKINPPSIKGDDGKSIYNADPTLNDQIAAVPEVEKPVKEKRSFKDLLDLVEEDDVAVEEKKEVTPTPIGIQAIEDPFPIYSQAMAAMGTPLYTDVQQRMLASQQYMKEGGFILDLDENEALEYAKNGYIVEELGHGGPHNPPSYEDAMQAYKKALADKEAYEKQYALDLKAYEDKLPQYEKQLKKYKAASDRYKRNQEYINYLKDDLGYDWFPSYEEVFQPKDKTDDKGRYYFKTPDRWIGPVNINTAIDDGRKNTTTTYNGIQITSGGKNAMEVPGKKVQWSEGVVEKDGSKKLILNSDNYRKIPTIADVLFYPYGKDKKRFMEFYDEGSSDIPESITFLPKPRPIKGLVAPEYNPPEVSERPNLADYIDPLPIIKPELAMPDVTLPELVGVPNDGLVEDYVVDRKGNIAGSVMVPEGTRQNRRRNYRKLKRGKLDGTFIKFNGEEYPDGIPEYNNGGYIEVELNKEDALKYAQNGYIVEEMHEGGEPGHDHNDPPSYEDAMQVYKDSIAAKEAYDEDYNKRKKEHEEAYKKYQKAVEKDANRFMQWVRGKSAFGDGHKKQAEYLVNVLGIEPEDISWNDLYWMSQNVFDSGLDDDGNWKTKPDPDPVVPADGNSWIKPVGRYFKEEYNSPKVLEKPTFADYVDSMPVIKPELIKQDASLPEELVERDEVEEVDYKIKRGPYIQPGLGGNPFGRFGSKYYRGPRLKFGARRVPIEQEQIYPEGFVPRFEYGGPHDPPSYYVLEELEEGGEACPDGYVKDLNGNCVELKEHPFARTKKDKEFIKKNKKDWADFVDEFTEYLSTVDEDFGEMERTLDRNKPDWEWLQRHEFGLRGNQRGGKKWGRTQRLGYPYLYKKSTSQYGNNRNDDNLSKAGEIIKKHFGSLKVDSNGWAPAYDKKETELKEYFAKKLGKKRYDIASGSKLLNATLYDTEKSGKYKPLYVDLQKEYDKMPENDPPKVLEKPTFADYIDPLPIIKPELIVDGSLPEELVERDEVEGVDYEKKFGVWTQQGKTKRAKLKNLFGYYIPEFFNDKPSRSIKYKTGKKLKAGFYNKPVEEEQIYPEGFVPKFYNQGGYILDLNEEEALAYAKNGYIVEEVK